MRPSALLLLSLLSACASSGSGGVGGGTGGSGGGAAGGSGGGTAGGSGGGGAGEATMPCTPAGFMTAPSLVNHLPITGITSAGEQQAFAKFTVKDGGIGVDLSLTVADNASDGGPNVPPVSVRFNGCDLGSPRAVPGVGNEFQSTDAGLWQPTTSRFLTFEVVSAQGVLLYRNVLAMPSVLPKILSVTTPAGPNAKVDWAPMTDAGIDESFIFAWKRLGGSGLQSVGFANISPPAGTAMIALSQAAQLFQLEVKGGKSFSRVRLVSEFDVP